MLRRAVTAAVSSTLLAALAAAPAVAQTRAVPESRQEMQFSFAPVVKKVRPAVVNVYGTRVERRTTLTEDEFFRRFFNGGGLGMPRERAQRSLGSGVIVDPAGLVVTNHHVIEGMTEVKVALPDKTELEAEIVLRDPRTDLAVLKLKAAGPFPVLPVGNSDEIEIGDLVLAIGNPFGVGQTVTSGIVSALARTQIGVTDYQFFIQTDAAINPGNSGGALVDMAGRLIGINTAIYSRSGGNIGIGFAIPSTMVRVVVASAKSGGRIVKRPYLGASMQPVTAEIAGSLGLPRAEGALVTRVEETGPAAAAGLKRGDLVVSLDGQSVDNPESFGFRFATRPLGATSQLGIFRAGKVLTLPLKLEGAPETTPRDERRIAGRNPLGGATVVNLSPAVAEEFSLEGATEGVVVVEVEDGGFAARVGLRKGDVIMGINGQRIDTTQTLERHVQRPADQWRLTLRRGNQVLTTTVAG